MPFCVRHRLPLAERTRFARQIARQQLSVLRVSIDPLTDAFSIVCQAIRVERLCRYVARPSRLSG